MKLNKAIHILKHFNTWRRGDIETLEYSPSEIGVAIDVVLFYIENKG
jgi:hypothetical protein